MLCTSFQTLKVNLIEMVIDELVSMEFNSNAIHDSGLCSFCREDLFFSYRREKELNGRMIAVMGWTETKA